MRRAHLHFASDVGDLPYPLSRYALSALQPVMAVCVRLPQGFPDGNVFFRCVCTHALTHPVFQPGTICMFAEPNCPTLSQPDATVYCIDACSNSPETRVAYLADLTRATGNDSNPVPVVISGGILISGWKNATRCAWACATATHNTISPHVIAASVIRVVSLLS